MTPLTWYHFVVVICHTSVLQLGAGMVRCQSADPGVIPLRLGVPAGLQSGQPLGLTHIFAVPPGYLLTTK